MPIDMNMLVFFLGTFRLPPKSQLRILLNFFFPFIDIFSQVLNFTAVEKIVLLKQLSIFKKPPFQERRWSSDFPPSKTPFVQKHRAISRKKRWHSPPPAGLSLDFTPPPL